MIDIENFKSSVLPEIEKSLVESLQKTQNPCLEMCAYQLNTGGKRVRALLPFLICDYFNAPHDVAYPIATAVELTHNATLVHDDIQDGDEMRRHSASVWKAYGIAQAINCGNALFQIPYYTLNELKTPSYEAKLKIHFLLSHYTLKTIEGQSRELQLTTSKTRATLEQISKIATEKTSGLFIFPTIATLIALNKAQPMIDRFTQVLDKLGIVFQIRDDLTDLYGEKGRETFGNDIREGKISSLVALFSEVAPKTQVDKLFQILAKPRGITLDSDIAWVRERFDEYEIQKKLVDKNNSILMLVENSLRDDPTAYHLYKNIETLFNSLT